MGSPQVSVVISCYNYADYVARALQSVFAQTYQNFEIILVDDGSADSSWSVIEPFLNDPRLKYFYQDNQGQASAKNLGIQKSVGEYIAFLDADDAWEKSKLEKQLSLFQDKSVGVVFSNAKYINENNEQLDLVLSDKYLQPRSGDVTSYLFMNNFVPFSSSIVRKKCFDQFGAFNESLMMGIDWDLWLRLSTAYRFNYVPEQLLLYRVGHPGQMSSQATVRHKCSDIIMAEFIRQYPDAVTHKIIKRAELYTLCNRARYYSMHQPVDGIRLFVKALFIAPWCLDAYHGILVACRNIFWNRVLAKGN